MLTRNLVQRRWIGTLAVVLSMCAPVAMAADAPPDQAALQKQLDEARTRLDAAARDVARLSTELYGDRDAQFARMMHGPQGAMLGVNIGGSRGLDTGVEVAGVSPGGPAEAAGLRAGDVIVAVDATQLKQADGRSPSAQLVGYMRSVEPGKTVRVQYLRDGKRLTADVKTIAAEPMFFGLMRDHMPRGPLGMGPGGMSHPGFHGMLMGRPGFGSLELVPMTPGLGRYFGTDKGLLVVRAPREAGVGLEDGDVLMTIGGRTPDSAGQAFRILQSYDVGDKVQLGILRNRKRMDVDATMPTPAAGRPVGPPPPSPAEPPRPAAPPPPADGKEGSA